MRRELAEHNVNIHERVRITIHEHSRRDDVACGEAGRGVAGDAAGAVAAGGADDLLDVVVVHLELCVAHDLEPVDDGFDGGERVEVRIGGELLERRDVARAPPEEEAQGVVDRGAEDGRVEQGLPSGRGGEDRAAAEDEEEESGAGAC